MISIVEKGKNKLRENLIADLRQAIENAKVEVGVGLNQAEVIGCIEWIKDEFINQCYEDETN